MLRLIGAIVVILLIAGPLLVQIGLVDQGGLIIRFVNLETSIFVDIIDFFRRLVHRDG